MVRLFFMILKILSCIISLLRITAFNVFLIETRERVFLKKETDIGEKSREFRPNKGPDPGPDRPPGRPRKPTKDSDCHAPLLKIRGNGVATKVDDVYTREKYPTHTR